MILGLVILAHSWYPASCCGHNDCRPISCTEMQSLLAKTKLKIEPSEDDSCHICIHNGGVLCAFAPMRIM